MDKIIKFFKENYKLMIPIVLMVVLFLAFIVFYNISVNNKYREDIKGDFYQYFNGQKYEYKGIVTVNKKKEIIDFKSIDYDIEFDSTPIYYKNEDKVIFARDMSVVMPTLNCSEYLARGFSYINLDNNVYKLVTNKYNNRLNHYFLYDGDRLYFFIEEVILKYGNEEVKLSPFSYVKVENNNKYVTYYDKLNDVMNSIEISDDVIVKNDYYKIIVNRGVLDYQGSDVLLTVGIEYLNTIDMKD